MLASPVRRGGTVQEIASTGRAAAVRFDRWFFSTTAALALLIVLVGFAQTLYLSAWLGPPPVSTLLYVHGTVMTLWYVLFLAQVTLVARRRTDLHRRLGVLTALTGATLIPLGAAVAIAFIKRMHADPEAGPIAAIIAGFDGVTLVVFAGLVATALVWRQRPDVHKRLMTVASLSLLGPPLARLMSDEHALWCTYACVVLPIIVDTAYHRRLHPAFGWSGGLVLVTSHVGLFLALRPEWIGFALRTFG
jgi:hypothetical protein